jgi:hypothetical protein
MLTVGRRNAVEAEDGSVVGQRLRLSHTVGGERDPLELTARVGENRDPLPVGHEYGVAVPDPLSPGGLDQPARTRDRDDEDPPAGRHDQALSLGMDVP